MNKKPEVQVATKKEKGKPEVKFMENDYRDERDQRTLFVKNLPFSSSLDDVSTSFITHDES